jgi:hypothetical protein
MTWTLPTGHKGPVKGLRASGPQGPDPLFTHTGTDSTLGFQEVEAPRFHGNRHMKEVRLSAQSTGRLYPTGDIPGTHFC